MTREELKELILNNVTPDEMLDLLDVLWQKYPRHQHDSIDEEDLDEIATTIAETFIPPKYDNEQ